MAAKLYIAAKADHQPFDPRDHGFEFSATDVEAYLHAQQARIRQVKPALSGADLVPRSTPSSTLFFEN